MNPSSSAAQVTLAPGLTIHRLINGLWQVADMERMQGPLALAQVAPAIQTHLHAGLSTFDMADHYGTSEEIMGQFRTGYAHPSSLQLLTKWVPPPRHLTRQDVRAAVTTSLRRLQMERLDLLQYHAWNYAHPGWLEQLFYLDELRQEGLIHHLGLTNFDTIHLHMVVSSGISVVSNQVCFSLLDQRAAQGMAPYCAQHNIGLLAFGTLAGGFLSERWLGQPEPPAERLATWSLMKYKRFIDAAGGWVPFQGLLETLQTIAQQKNATITNIASRYILDQPGVAGIIIGTRLGEHEHIQNNLHLLQLSLNEDDHHRIKAALAQLHPIPGDCGDEYRRPPFLTASGDLSHHLQTVETPYPMEVSSHGTQAYSGTSWEEMAGYCRGLRRGNQIWISGTTATLGQRSIGGRDAAAQTHFIIDKIEGTLQALGATLQDVVRTRIFIKHMTDWEAVARAHGQRFAPIRPANTLVQADLIGENYLVEIEADAIVAG